MAADFLIYFFSLFLFRFLFSLPRARVLKGVWFLPYLPMPWESVWKLGKEISRPCRTPVCRVKSPLIFRRRLRPTNSLVCSHLIRRCLLAGRMQLALRISSHTRLSWHAPSGLAWHLHNPSSQPQFLLVCVLLLHPHFINLASHDGLQAGT